MTQPEPVTMSVRLDADVRAALEIVAAVDRRSLTQAINILLWEAVSARVEQAGNKPKRLVELVEAHNRSLGIDG